MSLLTRPNRGAWRRVIQEPRRPPNLFFLLIVLLDTFFKVKLRIFDLVCAREFDSWPWHAYIMCVS